MLKRGFRLREKEDFDRVFRRGKPLFFGDFGCRIAPNSLSHIRLGFSFTKKHLTLAVDRNRLRRIVTACFEEEPDIFPGIDIVFFTVKKPQNISSEAIRPTVETVIKHIKKLK